MVLCGCLACIVVEVKLPSVARSQSDVSVTRRDGGVIVDTVDFIASVMTILPYRTPSLATARRTGRRLVRRSCFFPWHARGTASTEH